MHLYVYVCERNDYIWKWIFIYGAKEIVDGAKDLVLTKRVVGTVLVSKRQRESFV